MTRLPASSAPATGNPRWKQILSDLRRRLSQGEFPDAFPGEIALSEHYGVSRGTIRAALRPLREEGSISAKRGQRPKIIAGGGQSRFGGLYSLFESVSDSGLASRSETLEQGMVASDEASTRLELPTGEALFGLTRVRFADDEPLAVDQVWIRGDVGALLVDVDFSRTALYREMQSRAGISPTGGDEVLSSAEATAELALLLSCSPGEVVFRIERLGWDETGLLEFRRTWVRADRFVVRSSYGEGRPRRETH